MRQLTKYPLQKGFSFRDEHEAPKTQALPPHLFFPASSNSLPTPTQHHTLQPSAISVTFSWLHHE